MKRQAYGLLMTAVLLMVAGVPLAWRGAEYAGRMFTERVAAKAAEMIAERPTAVVPDAPVSVAWPDGDGPLVTLPDGTIVQCPIDAAVLMWAASGYVVRCDPGVVNVWAPSDSDTATVYRAPS